MCTLWLLLPAVLLNRSHVACHVRFWSFAFGFHSAYCFSDSLPWGMAQIAAELRNTFSEALACLPCS